MQGRIVKGNDGHLEAAIGAESDVVLGEGEREESCEEDGKEDLHLDGLEMTMVYMWKNGGC